MDAVPPMQTMHVTLKIDHPDGRVEWVSAPLDRQIYVGRDVTNHVVLEAPEVSRRHVTIQWGPDGCRVTDTSANGTRLGGQRFRGGSVIWREGIPLQIGEFTLMLYGPGSPLPASPVHIAEAVAPIEPGSQRRAKPTMAPPAMPGSGPIPGVIPHAAPMPNIGHAPAAPYAVPPAHGSQPMPAQVAGVASGTEIPVELRRRMHAMLLDHLDLAGLDRGKMDEKAMRPKVRAALRRITSELATEVPPGADAAALIDELCDEVLGLGPLEALLADTTVSEIMVVDPQTIYVERHGRVERTARRFTDEESVRAIIERIVTPLGRRIDESTPVVDARLKDGSRVHAIIPPLAIRGPCITIRKFSSKPLKMQDLVRYGTLTASMARFLERCVKARKNVLVSGGTGTGKTTLLNVLSAAIPDAERIITIEDAAELQLDQPHVVALESRRANIEGRGEYAIRELVRNALRMRPDRIVVGECRSGEALDMLQAMNTGHKGSMTTAHANSPDEALDRLETLALMGGVELSPSAARKQIASAIDIIVQQERFTSDGARRITSITEVIGLNDQGDYEKHEIFAWKQTGIGKKGEALGEFRPTGYLPSFLGEMIAMGLIDDGEFL